MKKLWILPVLLLLSACHIGSGFDTAERRSNLMWMDETIRSTDEDKPGYPTEDLPDAARLGPPVVYLLVAG